MGLFDRLWQLIRANLNHFITKAEDPEKILEQTVMEMQGDLIELRQAVAQAMATQKRTERQFDKTQSEADEWYKRAQLALQKGDEQLARAALIRRKSYQETANSIKTQVGQQAVIVDRMKQNMRALEAKIVEAKTKKDLYIARARSAQASERLQEMMGNFQTGTALGAFDRMEEKVLQLEARSQAMAELGSNDLESQFAALESETDIDTELQEMKAHLRPGQPPNQLPGADA